MSPRGSERKASPSPRHILPERGGNGLPLGLERNLKIEEKQDVRILSKPGESFHSK